MQLKGLYFPIFPSSSYLVICFRFNHKLSMKVSHNLLLTRRMPVLYGLEPFLEILLTWKMHLFSLNYEMTSQRIGYLGSNIWAIFRMNLVSAILYANEDGTLMLSTSEKKFLLRDLFFDGTKPLILMLSNYLC